MHIKKGDTVKILAGKDKGKTGKVIKSIPTREKVIVDGINMFKKHVRPRKEGEKGETIDFSAPMHVSNMKKTKEDKKTVTKDKKKVTK